MYMLSLFSDYAQKFWSHSLQETPETSWIHRLRLTMPKILSNLGYMLQLSDLLRSFLQSNAYELTRNNIWYKQQSLLKGQTLFHFFMVKLLLMNPEGGAGDWGYKQTKMKISDWLQEKLKVTTEVGKAR